MKPVLIAGTIIVILALVSYSAGIFTEQRRRMVSNMVLVFLSVGIVLDVTATICMIIGSESSPFSLHGILGYSSLTAMLVDTILIWRFRLAQGAQATVPRWLHQYTRIAYSWWVLAFITGSLLVANRTT